MKNFIVFSLENIWLLWTISLSFLTIFSLNLLHIYFNINEQSDCICQPISIYLSKMKVQDWNTMDIYTWAIYTFSPTQWSAITIWCMMLCQASTKQNKMKYSIPGWTEQANTLSSWLALSREGCVYLRGIGYAYLLGWLVMSVFFMCLLPTPCAPKRTNVFLMNAGSLTTSSYVTRSSWSNTASRKERTRKIKRLMRCNGSILWNSRSTSMFY